MRAVENAPVLGGAKYPYRARLRTIVPVISRRLGALGMGGCMTLSHPQEGHACDNVDPHTGSGHRACRCRTVGQRGSRTRALQLLIT